MKHICLLCLVVVPCLSGCADGTLPELDSMNPYQRQQWRQDLSFGPTFHEQIAELKTIQSEGARLPAAEQEFRVNQLNALIRDDATTPLLRAQSVKALAAIPLPGASYGLDMASADEDPEVRVAACEAWGIRGDANSAESLATIAKTDTDVDVRITAVRALADFREHAPVAIKALGEALNDRDPALQLRAMKSLSQVSGRDYGNDVASWREFAQGREPNRPQRSVTARFTSWFY
jgi:HEAT repeat protein